MKIKLQMISVMIVLTLCLLSSNVFSAPPSFVGTITGNMTLNVPSDFADINAAIDYLKDKKIAANVIVTIQVADGVYYYTSPISINNSDGDKIQIIGNTINPNLCIINFANCHGILITNGNKLGLIDGFTINGNYNTNSNIDLVGIFVTNNSQINCGKVKMVINNFGAGIDLNGSKGNATNVIISNCYFGVVVNSGSLFNMGSSTVNNCIDGYYSQYGSLLGLGNCVANNCGTGYVALYNSIINATGCSGTSNPPRNTIGNYNSFVF
jgi:hypothetical protein